MTDPGLGCYVYCLTAAGECPPLEGLQGMDPAFGVEVLTHGQVSAVISPVSLQEFGAEPLKRKFEDLEWLERAARAHQSVLDRVLASEAVVPLRLCTIFADQRHVRDMIDRELEVLLEALERVRGHAEWSVKVLADPAAVQAAARERSPSLAARSAEVAGEAPGRAYLARKKLDGALRDEANALVEGAAEEIHARLQEQATAATLLPPQNPDLSRRSGEMLLNGAYLVDRTRAGAFAALGEDLGERHRERGLTLELSGPWAPYNFVTAVEAT
jgi:hypothetical protein